MPWSVQTRQALHTKQGLSLHALNHYSACQLPLASCRQYMSASTAYRAIVEVPSPACHMAPT